MLSERGRRGVHYIMKYGCLLKIYPYCWDPVAFRLKRPNNCHLILYHLRVVGTYLQFLFIIFRLVQTVKDPEIISRLRVMHIIWILAKLLVVVCNIQFQVRCDAILFFANSLFAEIDRTRKSGETAKEESENEDLTIQEKDDDPSDLNAEFNYMKQNNTTTYVLKGRRNSKRESENEDLTVQEKFDDTADLNAESNYVKQNNTTTYDWVSPCILAGVFLLFSNPAAHAAIILDIPCAPHYITSLYYNCKDTLDEHAGILEKIMWFLLEMFLIAHHFFAWSFNWSMCFLGLTWIKLEVLRFETEFLPNIKSLGLALAIKNYRRIQTLLCIFNDTFQLYLQFFPSILLTIAAFTIFGAIKYTSIPFHAYTQFPLCGLRCLFEAVTVLAVAALVNEKSKKCLIACSHQVQIIQNKFEQRYFRRFRKSTPILKCMSGSFYSFETSIVLVSLSSCLQLTFNLFVVFKVENK